LSRSARKDSRPCESPGTSPQGVNHCLTQEKLPRQGKVKASDFRERLFLLLVLLRGFP
jgi:hypothetical protein